MSAWKHSAAWNETAIQSYGIFAVKRSRELYERQERLDCADLCLEVLIDYASANGLPVHLQAKAGAQNQEVSFASRDGAWSTADDFLRASLAGIEANEVVDGHGSNYQNTCAIQLWDIRPGDMLAHLSAAPIGSRAGRWGHMQLVRSSTLYAPYEGAVPTSGEAQIYQGNIEARYLIFGSKPTMVQSGRYYFHGEADPKASGKLYYQRDTNKEEDWSSVWRERQVTPVRWNFAKFNAMNWHYQQLEESTFLV